MVLCSQHYNPLVLLAPRALDLGLGPPRAGSWHSAEGWGGAMVLYALHRGFCFNLRV